MKLSQAPLSIFNWKSGVIDDIILEEELRLGYGWRTLMHLSIL
jgi:hypothetical protein